MATNGTEQVMAADPHNDSATSPGANLSKDEVGWYFVEQYYTTLSKSPEKLHLFYGKRSQFVYGLEAEVAYVSVGRQAIQERIKKLDFQDCKVRVSNVDSQASFDNIVIQVIGEVSNKSGEPKKFVQTFVLAQQPSGYFVLNDILRYINEDGEEVQQKQQEQGQGQEEGREQEQEQQQEEQQQSADVEAEVSAVQAEAAVPEPVVSNEPEAVEPEPAEPEAVEAETSDDKAQDASAAPEVVEAEVASKASETVEPKTEEPAPAAEDTTVKESAAETTEESEKTKEPAPAPAAKAAAPAPSAPAPAEPAAPPKPMTWASRAAAAAGPRPVVPLPKTATPPAATQTRAPAPAIAQASAPTPAAAAAAAAAPAPAPAPAAAPAAAAASADVPAKEASGWQTAGADSKRQNRPQPTSTNISDKEGTMGYVKYVTEKVQDADLRAALTIHGELVYFDINRAKNCAFVEYKTLGAYQAALASNPYVVNGENIIVEPRRPKSTTYGGGNYGSGRGGASGRGRGGFDGNRSGGQGNPRGNFPGQNRGRGGAARGRGGAQVASS